MRLSWNLVVVTGAAGWLGRRLVDVLANGLPEDESLNLGRDLRVRCLVMPGEDDAGLRALSDRVETVVGDARNRADCERLFAGAKGAVLLHTIGIIHPRRVRDLYAVNVDATKTVCEAAAGAGVKRAVVVSSNSPCGCNPNGQHRFNETAPYRPYMHYGRSKMLMELAIKQLQQSGRIETVILRPCWFYGPYQPPRQTLFFQMIRDGKGPIVGDGNNLRSMCYIDNLCQGLIRAAVVPAANGKTYWIADERPYTMNEITDAVERLLEQEFDIPCAHKRLRLPNLASKTAWLVDKTMQSMGFYNQKIHVLSEMNKNIACDVSLAKKELGYSPTVDLEEGMRRSLKWILSTNPGLLKNQTAAVAEVR